MPVGLNMEGHVTVRDSEAQLTSPPSASATRARSAARAAGPSTPPRMPAGSVAVHLPTRPASARVLAARACIVLNFSDHSQTCRQGLIWTLCNTCVQNLQRELP